MKSFKLALITIIVLFLTDKIVFYTLYSIDKKVLTGEGIGKINHFTLVKDTTQYIVFGNSRANHHINPEVFGKSAYNIGVGGRKMAFSATLIQTLPTKQKQYVLLQIDPDYVFNTNYDGSDIDALYHKYHQNDVIKAKIDEINRSNVFSGFFWSLDYNGLVFSLLTNYLKPKYDYKQYSGYDPLENSKEQKEMFVKRLQKHNNAQPCKSDYKPSKLELFYLKQIKNFCENNDKVLILFTSPVYKDKCKVDNAEMVKLMNQNWIKYYDFTDYFSNDDNINYWKDENHLSKEGADKFSLSLVNSLKADLK
jgi:hypothetical protein